MIQNNTCMEIKLAKVLQRTKGDTKMTKTTEMGEIHRVQLLQHR